MTITCVVCGASATPDRDRTCPVCGADLPEAAADRDVESDEAADDADGPAETFAPPAAGDDVADTPTPKSPATPPPAVSRPATALPEDGSPPPGGGGPATPPSGDSAPPAGSDPANPPPAGHSPAAPPPAVSRPATPPPGYGTPPPAPRPQPDHPSGISQDMRTFATLTHLSAFVGAVVFLAFLGPLVMWLIRREDHPFLDHHGKEALNFNLSMLLYVVIGIVASIATVGLGLVIVVPAAVVFFVVWIVATIQAAIKANRGEGFRYPVTIRFIAD